MIEPEAIPADSRLRLASVIAHGSHGQSFLVIRRHFSGAAGRPPAAAWQYAHAFVFDGTLIRTRSSLPLRTPLTFKGLRLSRRPTSHPTSQARHLKEAAKYARELPAVVQ